MITAEQARSKSLKLELSYINAKIIEESNNGNFDIWISGLTTFEIEALIKLGYHVMPSLNDGHLISWY